MTLSHLISILIFGVLFVACSLVASPSTPTEKAIERERDKIYTRFLLDG